MRTTLGVLASWLFGTILAAGLALWLATGSACPGFDDEGPTAAPGSAYARWTCEPALTWEPVPMEQVELPAVLLLAAVVGAIVALAALVVRRRRRRVGVAWLLAACLVQPVVVGAAQGLPRDCLDGRTDSGACARDREQL